MTRTEFIELLTSQWPDVPVTLRHISLVQLIRLLAIDAFIKQTEGPAADALRHQLERIENGKTFSFTDA